MAAVAVDVGYLSQHLGVSEASLSTLVDAPTADLINAVLQAVTEKAQEYDELASEKMRADIELETAVRSAESHTQALKENAEKALKEVETLRTKLQEEESRRQTVENELQTLQSSSTTSQAQVDELQSRISRLEDSKKEAFSLVETKNKANDALGEDLQKLHQKNVELNQEVNALQKTTHDAQNALNSAKFKEQSVQQELDMTRRANEWFETELKTKSDEYLKYRKEKGARIAELQRLNDDATSNMEIINSTNQQLRTRLTESQQKTDDAFVKVQQLNDAAARSAQTFNQDRESHARLVELKDQQMETYKKRTRELEVRVDKLKDDAEREIRQVRKELEQVRQEREQCEAQIQEQEEELNHLRVRLSQPHPAGSAPQTPRNGVARGGSPFATPGSIRSKGNFTSTTQYLDEMYRLKGQIVTEKNKNTELRSAVDEMMSTLEAKGPEMQELSDEKERLESENERMTHLADEAFKNRDEAKKAARKAEGAAKTAQAEVSILQSQLRDLSTQLQMLLFNQVAEEKGVNQLTLEETRQLERLQKGEVAEGALADLSDTHQFISQQYVVYKGIVEMQAQNQELLRVTRELANQMESEEAVEAKRQAAEDHKELSKLRDTNEVLKDEVRSLQVRNSTYIQERDIFRRMAQQKVTAGELASILGGSVEGSQGVLASIESNPEEPDYASLLRELQTNFDAYRNEQTVDRRTLKEQAQKLAEEKNSLQAEIARINSQLTLASERYEMLQSNFVATQTENKKLQRRSQALSESGAKQDASIQKLAEEHVEDRAMLETMRSENANLKAEKNLWKGIQERLQQTNEGLAQEKSQLSDLLTSQQRIQNERDLSDAEARRRLQGQIDNTQGELTSVTKKLAQQVEEHKNLQLRKEFDGRNFQTRIDELSKTLSQVKEEHVATKTSRDHLNARVNELTVQLRNAEDRTERLQPIASSRPRNVVNADQGTSEEAEAQIQELTDEVSDIKRELDLANAHLENAKAQSEQYKELLQTAEHDLQGLTETQEQYRQEMESSITTKDTQIKEYHQRVENLSDELANTNRELSTLRDSQTEVARRYEDEKAMMSEDITRLRGAEERFNEMTRCHQQDLRGQAEIATKAQQDYDVELFKHAEAAKALQALRTEFNLIKTETASLRAEAESAKHTLVESERSWEDRRKMLEQEIVEVKARRDEANKTNSLLQQEYNKVISRIDDLQQNRTTTVNHSASDSPSGDSASNLQEINNYLRREKEILEVQYDLKIQEAKRLQQTLDYTQTQLDEARLKLDEERRSQADSGRSTMAHKDLMEKLNELNLFRESSATLRNELKQAHVQIEERTARIEELQAQVQPLEARVEELDSQKSFMEQEVKQLQEDRDRWQKRTEGILTKYGRADPEEVEQLKQKVSALEGERDALKETESPLQAKVEELETNLKASEERRETMRTNLTKQFKERSQQQTALRKSVMDERDAAISAKTDAEAQLATANTGLASATEKLQLSQKEMANLEQQFNGAKLTVERMQQELESSKAALAAVATVAPEPTAAPAALTIPTGPAAPANTAEMDKKLADAEVQLQILTAAKSATEQELQTLRSQLQTANAERDEALAKAQTAAQAAALQTAQSVSNGMDDGEITEGAPALSDQERTDLLAKIAAAEAIAKEATDSANAHAEEVIRSRSEKMKTSLNNKLQSTREQQRQEITSKLEEEFRVKLDQEKAIWQAEIQPTTAAAPATVPRTPAKPETPAAAPQTPVTSTPAVNGLDKMSDVEIRDWISKNPTVKAIVTGNIKKKLDQELQKLKQEHEAKDAGAAGSTTAEIDAKIAAAREQAVLMESKKSSLRINMSENKFKVANAKLGVVEKAAKETPERGVGEVWEVAKVTKPAPAQNAGGATTPKPSPFPGKPAAQNANGPASGVSTPLSAKHATPPVDVAEVQQALTVPKQNANPFATSSGEAPKSVSAPAAQVSPFSAPTSGTAGLPQPAATLPHPAAAIPQPAAGPGIPKPVTAPAGPHSKEDDAKQRQSSLPMPLTRGGRGGRGGVYQPPRGRGRGGLRGGMNPSAGDFVPGNKRPRGDAEAGQQNKRQRGGGGAQGGPQGGN